MPKRQDVRTLKSTVISKCTWAAKPTSQAANRNELATPRAKRQRAFILAKQMARRSFISLATRQHVAAADQNTLIGLRIHIGKYTRTYAHLMAKLPRNAFYEFTVTLLYIYYIFFLKLNKMLQQNEYVANTETVTKHGRLTVLVFAKFIARQCMHYSNGFAMYLLRNLICTCYARNADLQCIYNEFNMKLLVIYKRFTIDLLRI